MTERLLLLWRIRASFTARAAVSSCLGGFLVIALYAPVASYARETVVESFRKTLGQIDSRCRERKSGPYLDLNDPEFKKKSADTSCDILKLRPRDWREAKLVKLDSQPYPVPEHWLATEGGRFAHSIVLPPSAALVADTPMNSNGDEIFKRLCNHHAGEFVLAIAPDVTGVRQDRAFAPYPGAYRGLMFWTREKGDLGSAPQNTFVQPPLGEYEFLEIRRGTSKRGFSSYERGPVSGAKREINAQTRDGRFIRVPYVVVEKTLDESRAGFAYTWRGIWPGEAVEHGIEGFELIVFRTHPFEVLGVRRDFWRHGPNPGQRDARLTTAASCTELKQLGAPAEFVRKVLVPKPQ